MRLHRLTLQAFGPFAEEVDVDFDAVSAGGLFLIHGATGAGKTSLLDAICYALYADVPGARTRKGLRSDHSPVDTVPTVVLEFTSSGRRFRVRRSPEFLRPKKRGSGLLKVTASVLLEESVGGRWTARSSGHEEVADVLADVLGMGLAQFAKVALLPQGDFSAFLRASPEDRRDLLERLFDITVFSDVEEWLVQARRDTSAEVAQLAAELGGAVDRVADLVADDEHLRAEVGETLSQAVSSPTRATVRLRSALDDLAATLSALVSTAMAQCDDAALADEAAADLLGRERQRAADRRRGQAAQSRHATLTAEGPAHLAACARLDAADRAAGVRGHLLALDGTLAELAAAEDDLEAARVAVPSAHRADGADAHLGRLMAHDDTVAEIVRLGLSLDAARGRREHLATQVELAQDKVAGHARRIADHMSARAELLGTLATLSDDAARLDGRRLAEEAARARLDLARLIGLDRAAADQASADARVAQDHVLATGSHLLDLRERRLAGMSAELAAALAEGLACPVCGSAEHPEPAVRGPQSVDPRELEAAEQAHELARDRHAEADRRRVAVEARLTDRLARLDGPPDEEALAAAVTAAVEAVAAAEQSAADLSTSQSRLEELDTALAALHAGQREAVTAEADARGSLGAIEEQEREALELRRRHLEAHLACPCGATDDLADLANTHAAARAAAREWAETTVRTEAARDRVDALTQQAMGAAGAAGFGDLVEAHGALLPSTEVSALRARVTAYDRSLEDTEAVLAEDPVRGALEGPPPDLGALESAQARARATLLAATAAQRDAERRHQGLTRLRPHITALSEVLTPLGERADRVRELADLVSGGGPDNILKMRLTAFVLAARLEKVVALANERLAGLGQGRYRLEHSDERAARGARSGLGLRVLDQWTGHTRSTSTLSGGESFMASLALALGLADAVREEAGGFDLGTLFIDEGFGTLDDDSLDQVLGVLDGLQSGGRTVGVVSHVADLRSRIPHQIAVHKTETGSTVTVELGHGASGAA